MTYKDWTWANDKVHEILRFLETIYEVKSEDKEYAECIDIFKEWALSRKRG